MSTFDKEAANSDDYKNREDMQRERDQWKARAERYKARAVRLAILTEKVQDERDELRRQLDDTITVKDVEKLQVRVAKLEEAIIRIASGDTGEGAGKIARVALAKGGTDEPG